MEACIARGVDAHRAGRGLGHRNHVHEVAHREPRVLLRDGFQKGEGGETALPTANRPTLKNS